MEKSNQREHKSERPTEALGEWISVDDKLPEETQPGELIVVKLNITAPEGPLRALAAFRYDRGNPCFDVVFSQRCMPTPLHVTHWFPLPEAL